MKKATLDSMSGWTNNFHKHKKLLNKEQLKAVETIEGAVMVLAGPGTGKTQVVALRIAQILDKTHMDPTNILALTFTEAGVTALRRRLQSIIGSAAHKVAVYTFHGFSNEIIGIFPHLFTYTQDLRQVTEAERFILIEEILNASNNLKLLRPLRKPDLYVREISQKIKTVKQESVTPKILSALIKQANDKHTDKLGEFLSVYKSYNEELVARGWYDYEDTISFVVKALGENDEVKAYFQERYQYILVDEYQDTNNSQNQLVEALADFYKNPNLFVVGDDKQAIYRFQGASVANMLHFKSRYPDMQVISLKENYRNSPEILSASATLIRNNKNQINELIGGEVFEEARTNQPAGLKPVIYRTDSYSAEYSKVLSLVKNYKKNGTPLPSIAVLWRRRQDVKDFADYLARNSVTVSGQVIRQIGDEPAVDALIKTLKAISDPGNNIYLIAALRQTLKNKDLVELYKVNRSSNKCTLLIEKLIKSSSSGLRKEAVKLLDTHKLADTLSIQELVEWLILNTGHIRNIFSSKRISGIELLLAFYSQAKNFSKQSDNNLSSFLGYLDTVKEKSLEIPVQKLLPDSGVHVGTVHSAKGLEFDRVIIAGADEKRWTIKKKPELIKLPSGIVGLDEWENNTEEDERRLFYVAATRTRSSLDITYSAKTIDDVDVLNSQFIDELGDVRTKAVKEKSSEAVVSSKRILTGVSAQALSEQELEYARHIIRTSPFSYSDMRAYGVCPRQYYLSRVLRLRQPESEALMYGNVVHGALEALFREFRSYRKMPTIDGFKKIIEQSAQKYASERFREKILNHSLEVLVSYYEDKNTEWTVPVGVEHSFAHRKVMLGDIWITGKYDRIDLLDSGTRSVRVVDYKTKSRPISRNEIEGKTKSSDGEIIKQLTFYGMLAKNDSSLPYSVNSYMISVIDDKKKFKDEIIDIPSMAISNLEQEVQRTRKEILNLKSFEHKRSSFDKGCELCSLY